MRAQRMCAVFAAASIGAATLGVASAGGAGAVTAAPSPYADSFFAVGVASSHSFGLKLVVPAVSCTAGLTEPVYVTAMVEGQAPPGSGTYTHSGFLVAAQCQSGSPATYTAGTFEDVPFDATAGWTSPPPVADIPVAPGDVLSLSGTTSPTAESFTVTDAKSHQTFTTTGSGLDADALLMMTEGGDGNNGYDNNGTWPAFTAVKFKGLTLDGAVQTMSYRYPQRDNAGVIQIAVGKPSVTGSFSETYKTSN